MMVTCAQRSPAVTEGSVNLLRHVRNMRQFGLPVVVEYTETGLVPRLPTALLATGVMLLGVLSLVAGFVLDNVTRGRREIKRLAYLALPPLEDPAEKQSR